MDECFLMEGKIPSPLMGEGKGGGFRQKKRGNHRIKML
jgi:hypothetical protein